MAKLTIKDILIKIMNVYKHDIYILNYKYCLAGTESESSNIGQTLCVLNDEASTVFKEAYPEKSLIFIDDIKNAKLKLEEHTRTEFNEDEIKTISDRFNFIDKLVKKIDEWKSFDFDEQKILALFKNGETVELFSQEKNIPTVTISKSLFPLVTEKKLERLYYNIIPAKNSDELTTFVTSFDFELFQLYSIFLYMNLD